MLIVERDILNLHEQGENKVTEEQLRDVLRRYTLGQSLAFLGICSKMLFDAYREGKEGYHVMGIGAMRDLATGLIVSDFAIAYLANIFLTSRSNDWKAKVLLAKDRANLALLFHVYQNGLQSHEIPEHERTQEEININGRSILIRLYHEQFSTQFLFADLIARNSYIFLKIVAGNEKYEYIKRAFEEKNGINLEEYFYISLAIFALMVAKNPFFTIGQLTQATVEQKHILTQQNVEAFMKIRSTDYPGFRKVDAEKNANLSELHTKTRYNPLNQYPIIKTQRKINGHEYVIPSYPIYVKSTFDLFWYFDEHFSGVSPQEQIRFRSSFGDIFEEYVGAILKTIYGEENVHGEIKYMTSEGEVKFLDFYVEVGDSVYIFEAKANRFRLPTLQAGLETEQEEAEIKKFTKPVLQIKKRFSEIDQYEELAFFRGKKLVPIIIFADIPFVNHPKFYEEILSGTDAGRQTLQALTDLSINCCNIVDLEKYAEHSDSVSLDAVFSEMREGHMKDGVISIVHKYPKNKKPGFLDEEFTRFHTEVMRVSKMEAEEEAASDRQGIDLVEKTLSSEALQEVPSMEQVRKGGK